MTPTDEQKATEKARQLLSKKCATPQEHGWWVTPDNRAACLGCLTAALLAWGEEKRKENRSNHPEILCLCGSTRFVNEMAVLAWELEKDGKIVLGLHLLPANYSGVQSDHQAEVEGVKEKMDMLHLRKIDLADCVFIVNIGGYVGESTANEIAYARSRDKPVVFLEERPRPSGN